jgi:type IV secretory pathway VirB4 component
VAFLVGLHAILVGDQRPDDESYGLDPLERNLLESVIRAVYARAAVEGVEPRESHLRHELQRRADEETAAGSDSIASVLRTLAERLASFCGDGSYAYLLDRPTTIRHDSPLVVFDTQKVPGELVGAVLFVLVEHVTTRIEQQARSRLYATGLGLFEGRYALVIDEAWRLVQRRATGDWVNDLARRCRHLGLFLIAMSQQLSDFAGPYGKALLRNATQLLFLRQALDELEYIRDTVHLSDAEVATIARLKTVKGVYAQAYWINGTRGRAMVTFFVGATEYWLATSEPLRDVPLRAQALRDAEGNAWRALEALAELDVAAAG